jgi:pyruvate dehydrogenase (quinone)
MSEQVCDYVLQRLSAWGVKRIFGYPGDGINGFLGALDRHSDAIDFVQPRHEEMAAFMATAHAKFTGEIGVCMATSGPGAIHLLNGLYDAKLDHQPVLAIIGQQKRLSLGVDYQQEVDLHTLFKDVSVFVHSCTHPAQARQLVDRGIRSALSEAGVATLIFPEDVQEETAEPSPPREHGSVYTSIGWARPRILPPEAELDRAAEVLNAGERVAILVGQGAARAEDEVVQAAELLGAGIAKALLGRAVVPDDLPYVTGPIGLLGSRPSYEMMNRCDTLFMVGTSFPYSEWLPEEGQARGVEIDISGKMIGIRYPMEVHLVGDAKDTLQALLPRLHRKQDRSWQQTIERSVEEWWRVIERRAHLRFDQVNPQRVAWELGKRLPDNAILTADSGSSTTWWARYMRLRSGMKASLSGNLATMGPGTPYAIAAKFAFPDRPVIAFVGDGAFQMNGMNELITVKRYHERWPDQRLVFCVFNNEDLNQVTWEQRAMGGDRRFEGSQALPNAPYAKWAELLGFTGIYVDDDDALGDAWDAALNAGRPVVLDVKTDPNVPPVPPHVNMDQAKKLAKSLKGDPDRFSVLLEGAVEKWQEFRESIASTLRPSS